MDTRPAAKTNVAEFSTAYYLLEGLNEIGIDYLFCNLGTDHAPIIEEMAHRAKRGEPGPKVVRCPHENTAAHMAAGYALVTGRGQGVLVHVDVGTANAANGMHNMYRSRLPVLLMAGKAPYTTHGELVGTRDTHVHFVQEPFDQGSLVRPYTKWEWTLPSGVVVKEALRRAHSIMQSEPRGPVYLMMQRETLTEHWETDEVHRYGAERYGPLAGAGADPALIAALAARLLTAENPILITGYGGTDPLAGQKNMRLVRKLDAAAPPVLADPDLLARAVSNLVSNAIKYSPAGTDVTVSVRAESNGVCVEVADQGPGIPAGDLDRIFEKFYRVPRAADADTPGTGLGLALVREVAELHGGTVTVASPAGAGSVFSLHIPRMEESHGTLG